MNPDGSYRSRFEVSRENASMWLVGVILAFALVSLGVYGLLTGTSYLFGRRLLLVRGMPATALSIAYVMLGLTLNIRYVWSKIVGWEDIAEKLSGIALAVFLIALVFAMYKLFAV